MSNLEKLIRDTIKNGSTSEEIAMELADILNKIEKEQEAERQGVLYTKWDRDNFSTPYDIAAYNRKEFLKSMFEMILEEF